MTTPDAKTAPSAAGKRALALFMLVVVAGGLAVMFRPAYVIPPDELQPAVVLDTPLRVPGASGDLLLLLTEQSLRRWERRSRASSRLMVDGAVHYSMTRWELWALDADSLRVRWRQPLREARPTLPVETPARLLGSDGEHVWWQAGEGGTMPEGVAPQAPAPKGPQARRVADGQPGTVAPAPGGLAYVPAEDEFTPWRYQSRSLFVQGQWWGLLDEDEAAGAGSNREREAGWPGPGVATAEGEYRLWRARAGQALAPSLFGAPRFRFDAIEPLGAGESWRQAGWLRYPGSGEVITATSPEGAYLLHRGPSGWQLDRIATGDGRRLWRVDLPQARLNAVSAGDAAVVFTGTRDGGVLPGTAYEQLGGTVLSAIAVDSGERRDFDLAQASVATEPKP